MLRGLMATALGWYPRHPWRGDDSWYGITCARKRFGIYLYELCWFCGQPRRSSKGEGGLIVVTCLYAANSTVTGFGNSPAA
jgi:hypothetical protein